MIPFLRRIGCSLSDIQSTSEITRRKDMHTQIESRLRWVAGPKQKLCFRKTEKASQAAAPPAAVQKQVFRDGADGNQERRLELT